MTKRLPNFLVIGSSRSGTTSLHRHLREHPQVFVATPTEPRFFAFEGDPMQYCGPGDEILAARVVTRIDDYASLFRGVENEIAVGEVSPAYLSSASAPACIHRHAPDAKLIVILRNPVDRAISSHRLEVLDGTETEIDFERAIALEDERRAAGWSYVWQYLERGNYHSHLVRYLRLFPRDRMLVLLYEDWQHDGGRSLLSSVYDFLGVDTAYLPERAHHENTSASSSFDARGRAQPVVSATLHTQLLRRYREEIDRLENLIGRDLDVWRRSRAWPG